MLLLLLSPVLSLLLACAPSGEDSGLSLEKSSEGEWMTSACLYVDGAAQAVEVPDLLLYAEECWETEEGTYCRQLLLERLGAETLVRCTSGETWRGYLP